MTYDVAIVGAGAMGSAAARALAAAGREVVVLEQFTLGHDRGGSHGGTRLFRPSADTATRYGAEFRSQSPVKAVRRHNGLVELDVPGGAIRAAHVVVTAGCWAPKLLDGIVELPPFRVTQEQPRFFAPVAPDLLWPSFVDQSAGSYGLFEDGSGVKVGLHATGPEVDPDTRDFQVEPERDAELLRYVEATFPGLDTSRTTAISCLYDNTPDETFVIKRSGPITVAAGFSGTGFKFVPLVGQQVRDLVLQR